VYCDYAVDVVCEMWLRSRAAMSRTTSKEAAHFSSSSVKNENAGEQDGYVVEFANVNMVLYKLIILNKPSLSSLSLSS
jgi:hypothetical protein